MLNRGSEIICSRFVNCEPSSCNMNSTLGSVVPLAMFGTHCRSASTLMLFKSLTDGMRQEARTIGFMGKIERLRACGRTCTQMMMLVCTSVTGARRVCSVHLMFAIVRMICFQIATSSSSICSLQQECLQSILARMLGKMGFSYWRLRGQNF